MSLTRCAVTSTCRMVVACAVTVLVIAGCGGGGGSGSSGPAIGGSPATQAQVGESYSFIPDVQNSGSSAVSFSIQNKPAWMSFSIATGQLTGTPTIADLGAYEDVVISVSDGGSGSSLPPFSITVTQGATGSVTLSWSAPTTNTDGTPLTDLAGYTISYGTSAVSLNQSLTIASQSVTTYTVGNLAAGTWYFSVAAYATDGSEGEPSGVVSTTVD